jgi:hypothetical protein
MPRAFVVIPLLVVVVGIVWVLTVGTLLGALLVVAGVMALGVNALPGVIDWFTRGLSAGFWNRH